MPPKNNKNFPPVAVLSLTSVSGLTAVVSTQGTRAGATGKNRRQSTPSPLLDWTIYWGDGTRDTGLGNPPISLTHSYPNPTSSTVVQLIVTAENTLTAQATLAFAFEATPEPPPPPPPAVPPVLLSITRMDESPTTAAQVRWQVVFDVNVTGVTLGAFSLAASGGIAGATLAALSGSGTAYIVTALTGVVASSGSLGLNLTTVVGIVAANGETLANTVTGEVYAVDAPPPPPPPPPPPAEPPTVLAITRMDPSPTDAAQVRWQVTFSEAVQGVTLARFSLAAIQVVGASLASISGSNASYIVTALTGTTATTGTLGLNLSSPAGITSVSSGLTLASGFVGEVYGTIALPAPPPPPPPPPPPTVQAITRLDASPTDADAVGWQVTFSEPVQGVTLGAFSLASVGVVGAAITVLLPDALDLRVYRLTATTGTNTGTLGLNLSTVTGISSIATGVALASPFTGEVYEVRPEDPLPPPPPPPPPPDPDPPPEPPPPDPPTGTVPAASCNVADVQAVVNSVGDGATVYIPPGTCTWTQQLQVFNKAITITGAGIGVTVLIDGVPKGSGETQMLLWTLKATGQHRLAGCTFDGGLSGGMDANNVGMIKIAGQSVVNFRLDHARIHTRRSAGVFLYDVLGVIDHCDFVLSSISPTDGNRPGIYIFHPRYQLIGDYGDNAWAQPTQFGTNLFMFAEDCTFTSDPGSALGLVQSYAADGWSGQRVVFRRSRFTNCTWANHGTESGGRLRGARATEIYENVFEMNSPTIVFPSTIGSRGGAMVGWGNTLTTTNGAFITRMIDVAVLRANQPFFPWGQCDGTSVWDQNTGGEAGWHCLDQPGAGQGGLLSGETATPVGWPTQATEPNYFWNNTRNGLADAAVTNNAQIQLGRDFFNSAMPGYVPFQYPHPLATP